MSNVLIICTNKVLPEKLLAKTMLKSGFMENLVTSYFTVLKEQDFGLNSYDFFKCAYLLHSPIYFELEKETAAIEEIYASTKELLLWLHNFSKTLLSQKYEVKLIKANYGENDDVFVYEENMDLSYLLQEEVVFDRYVLYNLDAKLPLEGASENI